jgi:hypothetical protein
VQLLPAEGQLMISLRGASQPVLAAVLNAPQSWELGGWKTFSFLAVHRRVVVGGRPRKLWNRGADGEYLCEKATLKGRCGVVAVASREELVEGGNQLAARAVDALRIAQQFGETLHGERNALKLIESLVQLGPLVRKTLAGCCNTLGMHLIEGQESGKGRVNSPSVSGKACSYSANTMSIFTPKTGFTRLHS